MTKEGVKRILFRVQLGEFGFNTPTHSRNRHIRDRVQETNCGTAAPCLRFVLLSTKGSQLHATALSFVSRH